MIKRLRDSLPATVEVIPLPDTSKELSRPFEHGQICVYYAGLTGKPKPSTSGSVEARKQVWQLLIRHRSRRKDGGLNGLIDAARMLLVGFLPSGATERLQLEEESAPEILDGLWASFITFSAKVPVMPLPDPSTGPRLARAIFENQPHAHSSTVENTQ